MANDLPIRFDIEVRQRATFRERFQIPLDCTNRDVQASAWSIKGRQRNKLLVQFEVEWENRAKKVNVPQPDGTTVETIYADFYLVASYEQTAQMNVSGVWDLLVIEHNGERTYWMEGIANMNPGMTGALT